LAIAQPAFRENLRATDGINLISGGEPNWIKA
jgi:hypothetical protein